MLWPALRVLCAAFVSMFVSSHAYAICDNLTEKQRFDRATLIADIVVENLEPGALPDHVVATVAVLNSTKGSQPGARLKVLSAYNQAESIRFPAVGNEFHLLATGGPEIFHTSDCLYFRVSPLFFGPMGR
jgi:hypothetical protein